MNNLMTTSTCCLFSIDCKLMWVLIIIAIAIMLAVVLPVFIKYYYEYRTLKFKAKQKKTDEKQEFTLAKEKYERMVKEFDTKKNYEAILKYLIDSTEDAVKIEEYKNKLLNLFKTDNTNQ